MIIPKLIKFEPFAQAVNNPSASVGVFDSRGSFIFAVRRNQEECGEIPTPALDPPVRLGLTFSVLKVVIICMKTIMSLHTILIISYLPALCQSDFKILLSAL